MAYKPDLSPNVWTSICAVCGFRFNSNELKQRWDGVMVCAEDWEPRNVLDFFRVPKEDISVPWTLPEKVIPTNYDAITSTDSPYTLTNAIDVLDVDATGGNITVTLPLANTYTFAQTSVLRIRRTDSSTNTVTIQRQGGDTLNWGTSETVPVLGSKAYQNNANNAWWDY